MIGCAGDPRTRLTQGDLDAVAEFRAWLESRTTPETPDPTPDPKPLERPRPVKP